MARRRQNAARQLRTLLNECEAYRSQWSCLAGKTPPGEISQAAVAKVIVDHLRKTGIQASELDYRLLKDRVCRGLSGRALTSSTLQLFMAGFSINDAHAQHLWAL